ncbi:D-lactate dehydrogenase [Delitschia confertaspora ATCC 74209]|uniref:D-lactate dehydrogenase (cytochrome) n=1 Tax=Delitschia confertaspora ATCC 74209 TaxID=1513339 RepID=A0A9P4MY80_9PLEO|nr:D-lactate dehydrogenase [Delitschia confertaspora ATCC 74209]
MTVAQYCSSTMPTTLAIASSSVPSVCHDTSTANLLAARAEFVALIGSERTTEDPEICTSHSGSKFSVAAPSHKASIVLYPETTEEVSSILKICWTRSIPVTPYSGGTGLAGSLAATRGGVCVDLSNMTKIWNLHESDMDVTVQPGVGWMDLNAKLEGKGLFFPPDPAPAARIGGMIAMGCSGTNAYRYGTMKDWVISLTVVLADGTIVKTRNRPRKSSAGYDLTHLIVGSEGTLGIVTEAVLKLTPRPQNSHVAILPFSDTYLAIETAITIMSSGEVFDAVEFVDHHSLGAVNGSGLFPEKWEEVPTLFLKFSGARQATEAHTELIKEWAKKNGCHNIRITSDLKQGQAWWDVRKLMGKALVTVMKPGDIFFGSDAAVPRSRLADIIVESQKATENVGLFCSTLGHIGDGNVHVVFFCPGEKRALGEKLIEDIQRMALRMEGTITGEHGIGLSLRDMLIEEVGHAGVDMMRKVKLALDPKCILNCDKVIRMEA